MTRYTVNLSRARSFSRRKRAQKAMSILRAELEEREGEKVSISPEVNSKIWENGMERPPAKINVEVEEASGRLVAVLPGETVEEPEPEEEDEAEEEESGETDEDYSEIVSGTVSEAKDVIDGLEDPDYEELHEAEKDGKDRKTLKEFIKSRM